MQYICSVFVDKGPQDKNNMSDKQKNYNFFREVIQQTKLIQLPVKNISSFGTTVYNYYLLCPTEDNHTIIHEGNLNVKTPLIISLYSLENNLNGFDKGVRDFTEKMFQDMGLNSPLLEYQFQHIAREQWVEKVPLFRSLNSIKKHVVDKKTTIILVGREDMWSASLIKACLKIVKQSVPKNLIDFEQRGFLDKEGLPGAVYKEIENLFSKAKGDRRYLEKLGNLLLHHNVFERYEERFFSLFSR